MIRTAALAFCLLAWAPIASAQGRPGGCAASPEAGWIARVDESAGLSVVGRPDILRGHSSLAVDEGASLCADDVIRNPRGSGRKIWFRLTGRELVGLMPGDRPYRVRAPGWLARASEALKPLNGLALWRRRADVRTVPARTRGEASVNCRYAPEPSPGSTVKGLQGWGPLFLSWHCPTFATGDWRVTIESGATRRSVVTPTNMVSIDPEACPGGCTVEIASAMSGFEVKRLRLEIVAPADAGIPNEFGRFRPKAVGGGRLAAWLLGRGEPEWRAQAMSLLWTSGCRVPIAGQAAALLYGAPSTEDLCMGTRAGLR